MSDVPVSQARASLPQIVDRVERGEEVTLTRHGRPVAVVVRPDVLRVRRAGAAFAAAERVADIVRSGRRRRISGGIGLSGDRAEELAAEVRADRDTR